MQSKRELVAGASRATGLTSVLERMPRQNCLIAINYHRIGNSTETEYDPGVFTATAEEFEWQVRYLKEYFELVTLDAVVDMVKGARPFSPSVLITFDDGYIDNYELAFPILRAAGAQGTFFLPTSYIGTDRLPWWDLIAYIVKKARNDRFTLTYPRPVQFSLHTDLEAAIADVLKLYRQPDMLDGERFIGELLESADSSLPTPRSSNAFMNWQQAREMRDAGMAFGGHTHRHEILSKMPVEVQHEDLLESREILERELNQPIVTMAYPVGGRTEFSEDTKAMVEKSGYSVAFSHYGGFNHAASVDPYDVKRFAVDVLSRQRFRLNMALGAVSGSLWI